MPGLLSIGFIATNKFRLSRTRHLNQVVPTTPAYALVLVSLLHLSTLLKSVSAQEIMQMALRYIHYLAQPVHCYMPASLHHFHHFLASPVYSISLVISH